MALVDEDEQLAHRRAGLLLQLLDEGVEVLHILAPEFVDQRAQQARFGLAELGHEVAPAAGAVDRLTALGKHPLDLLIQLVAIGEDQHASLGPVFENPFCEQHHHDALPAALRVPDDAALERLHVRLRRLDAEVLVDPRQLFHAAVEDHEVVDQFEEPVLPAHLQEVLVEFVAGVVCLVLLPRQEVLFLGSDGTVAEPLGIIAGEDDLHRGEEPFVELPLLVRKELADAVTHRHVAALELDHAHRDAVDVEHEVRAALMVAAQRHLLGEGEIVVLRMCPIDDLHGLRHFVGFRLQLHAVA